MARPVPDGVEITMRDTEERRDQTLRFVVRNHDETSIEFLRRSGPGLSGGQAA